MVDQTTGNSTPADTPSGAAVGLTVFAGTVMIMVGVFQAIQGVVALFNDTFYVVGQKWTFSFDITEVARNLRKHKQLCESTTVTFIPEGRPAAKANAVVRRVEIVEQ
jgi:hypothetical protein